MNLLKIRFFLGVHVTNDLKNHLFHSPLWKEANSLGLKNLELIGYENKEFLGKFIDIQTPSLKDLHRENLCVKQFLENYCPELRVDRYPMMLFPQIFIG